MLAAEKGKWTKKTIQKVPVTINWKTPCTLLEHIHTVTLMVIVGLLIAKYVVQVTKIPNSILMPVVVPLALIGSYAINGSMFDAFVTIFFGAIGYMMEKYDLSAPALILGLILGGQAERGLMLSFVMAKGDVLGYYLGRPICVGLIVFIALSILYPLFKAWQEKKKAVA